MAKRKIGHKANSQLNGEWGKHVRKWMKKITSGKRRHHDKEIIREEVDDFLYEGNQLTTFTGNGRG